MSDALPNDMWRYRKRHGLTQDDLALLMGTRDGTSVSRYERGKREPSLRMAFACQAAFGVPAHELFSGIYEEVEQDVITRAHLLSERLRDGDRSRVGWYKRKLLGALGAEERGDAANQREEEI